MQGRDFVEAGLSQPPAIIQSDDTAEKEEKKKSHMLFCWIDGSDASFSARKSSFDHECSFSHIFFDDV